MGQNMSHKLCRNCILWLILRFKWQSTNDLYWLIEGCFIMLSTRTEHIPDGGSILHFIESIWTSNLGLPDCDKANTFLKILSWHSCNLHRCVCLNPNQDSLLFSNFDAISCSNLTMVAKAIGIPIRHGFPDTAKMSFILFSRPGSLLSIVSTMLAAVLYVFKCVQNTMYHSLCTINFALCFYFRD